MLGDNSVRTRPDRNVTTMLTMQNPFRDIVKADELDPELAAKLFVRKVCPIWSEVCSRRNHIIVGPRGAGKTIALRQLDSRTHTTPQDYIGLYVQISRISALYKIPFEHLNKRSDEGLIATLQKVFSDHIWLEVMRLICITLEKFGLYELDNAVDIEHLFGVDVNSLATLETFCAERQRTIEESLMSWSRGRSLDWKPVAHLPSALHRCGEYLRTKLPHLATKSPCIYLLLDESSPIPFECQLVMNELLHRGRNFCTKLAIRPFEWDTLKTNMGRNIEIDTDIIVSHIRYSNELEEPYITNMIAVVDRALRTRLSKQVFPEHAVNSLDILRIFPADPSSSYSGFDSICAASSGNPQNLLQICSCIFRATESVRGTSVASMPIFPPQLQDQAIRAWSRDHEDHNPYYDSRAFCRSLLRSIRTDQSPQRSIGFSYLHSSEADLFTHDYLPSDIGELIRSAFSGGFLRRTNAGTASLFEVPSEFHLSRGLLPREGLPIGLPILPATSIDHQFIRYNTRDHVRLNKSTAVGDDDQIKAFLSTSFSRLTTQQRADIKQYLQSVAIDCVDIENSLHDQFLFTSTQNQIKNADIVILDATILRPYTMLEVGMCAGILQNPKNVICVLNEESCDRPDDPVVRLPEFMHTLPIILYSFDHERLQQTAVQIAERARALLSDHSEFSYTRHPSMPLRPKRGRDSKTVYVSLPYSSMRDRVLEAVREALKVKGWSIIHENQVQIYLANELQTAINCAFTAGIGVVDTSGRESPDLLQCFKLGLFAGKRGWRVLQMEQVGQENRRTFASVPGLKHSTWESIDEFVRKVTAFVTTSGREAW